MSAAPDSPSLPVHPYRTPFLHAVAIGGCFLASSAFAEEATVLATLHGDNTLQVSACPALSLPRHHAGCYVEWTNERRFLARRHLVKGAPYRVKASVVKVEVRRFPEGWGARSGMLYSTVHLRAISAARAAGQR